MNDNVGSGDKVCEVETGPEADATLGIVLRMPIDRMPEAIRKLKEVHGARIVYQRKSVGYLKIVDER